MGNCCCTEEQDDDVNERSRLLGGSGRRTYVSTSESNDGANESQNPLSKNDEHRALSDILDQTVRNIIDVSQLENCSEQQDHLERAKKYSDKISSAKTSSDFPMVAKLKDSPNADKVLSSMPLSISDYELMVDSGVALQSAMRNVAVTHRSDLLVTFAVNT